LSPGQTKIRYLAYGSNLHPLRLQRRVPSAALLGTVELPGRALRFWKQGRDGSGKCTLVSNDPGQVAFGAIFEMNAAEKAALDAAEGKGFGYDEQEEIVQLDGDEFSVFVYIASPGYVIPGLQPYSWYKRLVLAGARYHRFRGSYVDAIKEVHATEDPDEKRRGESEALLAAMERGRANAPG